MMLVWQSKLSKTSKLTSLVSISSDTALEGIGDLLGLVLGEILGGGRNLGGDGVTEFLGSDLLVGESLVNLAASLGLNGGGFFGDGIIDSGVHDLNQTVHLRSHLRV